MAMVSCTYCIRIPKVTMNDVIVESVAIVHQVIIANFVDNIFCIIHCGRLRHNMPTRVVIDNKSFTRLDVY